MEWIAEQIMNLLDMMAGSVLGALGCDMNTFLRYFPAAETMYTIFIALGMGFLLLNFVWQLFKNFGLGMGIEAEDPVKLTLRTILFMLCTVFSSQIVNVALKIGGTPYQWIVDAELPPLQFASFLSVITPIIGGIVSGSVLLISLIVIVVLAWNYLKLLFEAAERYILLGVLVFTAPVAVAMGGSQTTANIFKSWCRMLGGQIFLLLMNAWCLKLFTSMFGSFLANPLDDGGNLFIWLLCAVGFLKVSQKIDSFMGSLGIGVGRTGGSMLGELMIATKTLSGIGKSGGVGADGTGDNGEAAVERLQNADDPAAGYDPAADTGQPIPTSLDAGGSSESDTQMENGGLSSGGGPPACGDNGESAIAAAQAEAEMGYTSIPAGLSGADGVDSVRDSSVAGEQAGEPVGIDSGTSDLAGMAGASAANAAAGGFDVVTESTHTPIPTGFGTAPESGGAPAAGSAGTGSNEIPVSGSGDGGTVVTGADSVTAGASAIPAGGGGIGTSPGYTASGSPAGNQYQSDHYAEGVHSSAFSNNYGNAKSPYEEPPTYRDITMGGGRITGVEVSPNNPKGIEFAMYNTNQYAKPDGEFSVVKSLDGAKWYKQYAVPAVERTPVNEKKGKVEYREKIVKKLPKGPQRIDRI